MFKIGKNESAFKETLPDNNFSISLSKACIIHLKKSLFKATPAGIFSFYFPFDLLILVPFRSKVNLYKTF